MMAGLFRQSIKARLQGPLSSLRRTNRPNILIQRIIATTYNTNNESKQRIIQCIYGIIKDIGSRSRLEPVTLPSHDTSAVPTLYRLHHEFAQFHHPSYIFASWTKMAQSVSTPTVAESVPTDDTLRNNNSCPPHLRLASQCARSGSTNKKRISRRQCDRPTS